jgi:hypothetical protein
LSPDGMMLGMQIIRMNGKHANFEVEQKDLGFVRLGSFQLGGGGNPIGRGCSTSNSFP